MKPKFTISFAVTILAVVSQGLSAQEVEPAELIEPVRSEVIAPLRNESFNKNGACRERKLGGNPRQLEGVLVFDGATDGNQQVDPQIAVGEDHVLHATNSGLIIYSKSGEFVQGVSQACFNRGIDPKLFYDRHNEIFGFDLWNPWDKEKKKPVNISVSESSDPTAAWNTYPVPAPEGRDGGGIGYSKKWIGYSFPGGPTQTFVIESEQAKAGVPATVYHFEGNLGQPVVTQDDLADLHFVKFAGKNITITRVFESAEGSPVAQRLFTVPHGFKSFQYPPKSPQQGTSAVVASGDRKPKVSVIQSGCLWFSHTVKLESRSAIQWHQIDLTNGEFVQSGSLSHPENSFIQTTLAVNEQNDLLVGFQETGPDMFISPRFAYRRANDPPGELRAVKSLGEGRAATKGGPWGDYSGSAVDGGNMLDLWTVQSIADETGRGDTVIAKLPIEVEP